uniref:UBN2_3 domain-containing protein n=1 Tax=Lupinus angustifolius TaxID=3871 RepID=A0A182BFB8_LUPAN|nr:hypothetical protein [Lupinus angustifolius]
MKIFIEAIDSEIWESIVNGPFVPQHLVDDEPKDKPKSLWTDDEHKKVQYNLRAKHIITSTLSYDEFFWVLQWQSAKEMWDTLQVTHEGTSEVKCARLNALTHEYGLFRMLPNESIGDMQKHFTHIVNHLVALDKLFNK